MMNRDPKTLTGKRGAILVRVSTDYQDTASQEAALAEFIERYKPVVGRNDWYIEEGRSRLDSHKSIVLPRLRQAVQEGKYDFVLTFTQNRGGYKHDLEFAAFANFLLENGVDLWDTETGVLNDPNDLGTRIVTAVGNAASTKGLKEHAKNCLRGKLKAARNAHYSGGNIPFGFDVGIYDKAGNYKWRIVVAASRRIPNPNPNSRHKHKVQTTYKKVWPDGREELFEHLPAYEEDDSPRYIRTDDPKKLAIVRQIFRWYTEELWSFHAIARELLRLGIKPHYGDVWQGTQVRNHILANPVYVGRPAFGKSGHGAKLYQYVGGDYVEVPWHKNRPQPKKKKDIADHVGPDEGKHIVGIVDEPTWTATQERLAGHGGRHVPRNERQWLAGLVYCAGCGKPMITRKANSGGRKFAHFSCQSYKSHFGKPPTPCGNNHVRADAIEALAEQFLAEAETTAETLVKAERNPELLRPILDRYHAEAVHFDAAYRAMNGFIAGRLGQGESPLPLSVPAVPVLVEGEDVTTPEGFSTFDVYGFLYESGRAAIAQDVAALEKQREDLYERMKGYKSAFARKRADEEMDRLSDKIDALQKQLVRQDESARLSYRRLVEVQAAVKEARRSLAGASTRAKAEAVRKVIGRIVCHFEKANRGPRKNIAADKLTKVVIYPADGSDCKVCDPSDMGNVPDIASVAMARVYLNPCPEGKTPDVLTVKRAAAILRVSTSCVRLWEKEGRIRSVRTPGGHRRYCRADVEALRDRRR